MRQVMSGACFIAAARIRRIAFRCCSALVVTLVLLGFVAVSTNTEAIALRLLAGLYSAPHLVIRKITNKKICGTDAH